MASNTVQEIERAVRTLTPQELEEFSAWFDEYQHPLDARMEADLAAGRLDNAIAHALGDEKSGRVRSL